MSALLPAQIVTVLHHLIDNVLVTNITAHKFTAGLLNGQTEAGVAHYGADHGSF